jgi:hypothetical protein
MVLIVGGVVLATVLPLIYDMHDPCEGWLVFLLWAGSVASYYIGDHMVFD